MQINLGKTLVRKEDEGLINRLTISMFTMLAWVKVFCFQLSIAWWWTVDSSSLLVENVYMDFDSTFSLVIPALIATVVHTFLGMAWFGPIFGRQWMKFMEFNKLSEQEKKAVEKQMPKLYMGQVGVTFLTNIILGLFLVNLYTANPYFVGFMLWLGFVFTSQSTATIWSQTKAKHVPSQIIIATLYQLVSIMITVALFNLVSL